MISHFVGEIVHVQKLKTPFLDITFPTVVVANGGDSDDKNDKF